MRARPRRTLSTLIMAALTAVVVLVPAPATAAVQSCDEAGLDAAIAAGGSHSFNCVVGTTIVVSSEKDIDKDLELDGGGLLEISGGGTETVFDVWSGVSFTARNLEIIDGYVSGGDGGNIYVDTDAILTLDDVIVAGGQAPDGYGGGIYASDRSFVTVNNSTIQSNSAMEGGGIFLNRSADLRLEDSSLFRNTAQSGGGIWADEAAAIVVRRSTLSDNEATHGFGGGIGVDSSIALTIEESRVADNDADEEGGGIYVYDTLVSIVDTTIEGNTAGNNGGGAYVYETSFVDIQRSEFLDNSVDDDGGGLHMTDVRADIVETTFAGNMTDDGDGAGLFAEVSDLSIEGSTFEDNDADSDGGALAVKETDLTFRDNRVASNKAGDRGGGLYIGWQSDAFITDSTIESNEASTYGGGIAGDNADSLEVTESTMSSNSAQLGGGIYGDIDLIVVRESTIAANTAEDEGGGIYAEWSVEVFESALLGNTAGDNGGAVYSFDTSTIADSCIVGNSDTAVVLGDDSDARNNWWGDPSGPSGEGPGTGDSVGEDILFDPWADAPLRPCGYVGPPWNPDAQPSGLCEVLVWFDSATVLADTEAGVDEWHIQGVARFYDTDEVRDRQTAVIGLTSFSADAGETVVLEQQWRTELWGGFDGQVRLDDLAFVVSEDDGRAGNDKGQVRGAPPEVVLDCGSTTSGFMLVPVAPQAARGQASTDAPGLVVIEFTITTVPAMFMSRRR